MLLHNCRTTSAELPFNLKLETQKCGRSEGEKRGVKRRIEKGGKRGGAMSFIMNWINQNLDLNNVSGCCNCGAAIHLLLHY